MLLFDLPLVAPVIFGTSFDSAFAPMNLPATEGAAQILATGITGMGEKQYLAMPAAGQVFFQVGFFFKYRADNPVVARYKTANIFLTIPVRKKLKIRLDLYYKKAKCSLMSLMYLGIPSLFLLYSTINKVQRGFFFCKATISAEQVGLVGYR